MNLAGRKLLPLLRVMATRKGREFSCRNSGTSPAWSSPPGHRCARWPLSCKRGRPTAITATRVLRGTPHATATSRAG